MRQHRERAREQRTAKYIVDLLEPRLLLAAQLVADINATLSAAPVSEVADVNGTAYFCVGYTQIWKSDGTPAGTVMLKNLGAMPVDDFPYNFLSAGGKLYFVATDRTTGFRDLWVSDGTPQGTVPLHQLPYTYSEPGPLAVAAGDRVFFAGGLNPNGNSQSVSAQLWSTDGTPSGTVLVKDTFPLDTLRWDFNGVYAGGTFYFSARDSVTQQAALWKSDGTTAGTSVVKDLGPLATQLRNFAAVGDTVYFTYDSTSTQLMKTDGTAAGTVPVATINVDVGDYNHLPMAALNGSLIFAQADATQRNLQVWTTVSTGGIAQLSTANLFPPTFTSYDDSLTNARLRLAGGKVFFWASDGVHGGEPWVTDGTPAGTQMIEDVNPGSGNSGPVSGSGDALGLSTAVLGNRFYFAGNDGTGVSKVYASDGTAAGTTPIAGMPPGGAPAGLASAGAKLFVLPYTPQEGTQVLVTDGAAPAQTIGTFSSPSTRNSQSAGTGSATLADGSLVFAANDGIHGSQLYRTDRTPAGTSLVDAVASPWKFTTIGGKVYFEAASRPGSMALWTTDGTAAGTEQLTTAVTVVGGPAVDVVGTAYFFALGPHGENELWRSDGTPDTTTLVSIYDSSGNTPETAAVALNGMLYFTAATGAQLWRSDGTAVGTSRIFAGTRDQTVQGLAAANGRLFFVQSQSTSSATPVTLYQSDGTFAGTVPVSGAPDNVEDLTGAGDAAYFFAYGSSTTQLFRCDGMAGVQAVFQASGGGADLTPYNGTILFVWDHRLWRTDGSSAGTVALSPSTVNAYSYPDPPAIAVYNNLIYFAANATNEGQVWVSDGTPTGTQLAAAGVSEPFSTGVTDFAFAGGKLYFQASTPRYGRELWELPLPAPSVTGRVFDDANHDGSDDAGDTGLSGAVVYVDANGNGQLDSGDIATTSDVSGKYSLVGLAAGTYAIRQQPPLSYRRTTAPASTSVTIGADQPASGPLFGDVQVSTVAMDFNYLLTLAQHYGQSGTFATGDVNDDGTVNFADLLLVAQNYGHPLAAAAAGPDMTDSLARLHLPARKRSRQ